jgi:hypothetical protein
MATTIYRLKAYETITLKVVRGKWYDSWTHPLDGENPPKEKTYQPTPGRMCPSHRDMGYETWEGPGTIVYETRNYM